MAHTSPPGWVRMPPSPLRYFPPQPTPSVRSTLTSFYKGKHTAVLSLRQFRRGSRSLQGNGLNLKPLRSPLLNMLATSPHLSPQRFTPRHIFHRRLVTRQLAGLRMSCGTRVAAY